MSEESKKSYTTWEEALQAFQLYFQNKLLQINTRIDEIKNIINESPKDDLMAFLEPVIDAKIDSKIEAVVTEKVASASFNKVDEEILPGLWTAIQKRDELVLAQTEKVINMEMKLNTFVNDTKVEIVDYFRGPIQAEFLEGVKEGVNGIREELDRYREATKEYHKKIEDFEENISRISNQQILDTSAIERLEEAINSHPKESDKTPEEI